MEKEMFLVQIEAQKKLIATRNFSSDNYADAGKFFFGC
jgi:hypothetical protein